MEKNVSCRSNQQCHSHQTKHSHERKHHSRRHKRNSLWRRITRPFRHRRGRVSGVRTSSMRAERRMHRIFTIVAVVLLCILIPIFAWLSDVVNQASQV